MALVKLIDSDGLVSLRTRRGEQHFEMSVPQVGNFIKYYKFNDGDIFENEPILYKVLSVRQQLQEHFNGTYIERFEVVVLKVSE
ncbi:hypothetical protein bcere0027_53370 [Bacillus cereus AH676]|uniref:hypothetical protein n=1 Tax=Bacillus cereus TaxID=1396 RepID=UPI0001A12554|nr:hypothetical protein [Bacillus cereus]EEL73418.1 hypothetical protein bcere0027_53370 [Bacillus cereus AH676]